jgi:hypothetical protein
MRFQGIFVKSIGAVFFLLLTALLARGIMQNDSGEASELQEQLFLNLQEFFDQGVEGSFLIFDDRKTHKFVQFSFDKGDLIFDLPMKALSPSEQSRAVSLLAEYGFPLQTGSLLDGPGGTVVAEWSGWDVALPGAARQGAEIAGRVFHEVFQLTGDIELSIEYGK